MSFYANFYESRIKTLGVILHIFKICDFGHPIARRSECSDPNSNGSISFCMQKWASMPILIKSEENCESYSISSKKHVFCTLCPFSAPVSAHIPILMVSYYSACNIEHICQFLWKSNKRWGRYKCFSKNVILGLIFHVLVFFSKLSTALENSNFDLH